MPSRRRPRGSKSLVKPWAARVYIGTKAYWLGTYHTREEALKAEEQFKLDLEIITVEAQRMWRERVELLQLVAPTVRENSNG